MMLRSCSQSVYFLPLHSHICLHGWESTCMYDVSPDGAVSVILCGARLYIDNCAHTSLQRASVSVILCGARLYIDNCAHTSLQRASVSVILCGARLYIDNYAHTSLQRASVSVILCGSRCKDIVAAWETSEAACEATDTSAVGLHSS